MENLKAALGFGGILSEEHVEKVTSHFQSRELNVGEYFSEMGNVAHEIGFIDSGIIRTYTMNEMGEEVTKYFFRKNQFIVDLQSYYNFEPSSYPYQAVIKSRVYYIKRPQWELLTKNIPSLFTLTKSISESLLLNKLKDNDFLSFGTAKDKYEAFMKRHPDFALYIPQQYIASYLKITPQSLSRIRKTLLKS